jgi:hypothetical protein
MTCWYDMIIICVGIVTKTATIIFLSHQRYLLTVKILQEFFEEVIQSKYQRILRTWAGYLKPREISKENSKMGMILKH